MPILRIVPDAIFWKDGMNIIGELRTHWKYSKRLYYAFRPLWWAIHYWDLVVADRWIPKLSFGFSVLTKYPDADTETTTVDGRAWMSYTDTNGVSWAALQGGAGTNANDADANEAVVYLRCDSVTDQWRSIVRGIFLFNTSELTSDATISDAVMSLYGSYKYNDFGTPPNIDIYTSAPASNTAIVPGDYDSLGSTSQTGSPITYAGFSVSGYTDFTLNSTGRGNISKTSVTKFGVRNANYDVANSAPTWTAWYYYYFDIYFADQDGTANDPKLTVTFTLPDTGGQVIIISRPAKWWLLAGLLGIVVRNPDVSRRQIVRWWK
jgi:hypothetical protein